MEKVDWRKSTLLLPHQVHYYYAARTARSQLRFIKGKEKRIGETELVKLETHSCNFVAFRDNLVFCAFSLVRDAHAFELLTFGCNIIWHAYFPSLSTVSELQFIVEQLNMRTRGNEMVETDMRCKIEHEKLWLDPSAQAATGCPDCIWFPLGFPPSSHSML